MVRIILVSWGGVEKLFADDLTMDEAREICDSYNYEWEDPNCGYIWDMWIEED